MFLDMKSDKIYIKLEELDWSESVHTFYTQLIADYSSVNDSSTLRIQYTSLLLYCYNRLSY